MHHPLWWLRPTLRTSACTHNISNSMHMNLPGSTCTSLLNQSGLATVRLTACTPSRVVMSHCGCSGHCFRASHALDMCRQHENHLESIDIACSYARNM